MNSQIYDSGDDTGDEEAIFEKADDRVAQLHQMRSEIAERRRALIEPSHKVVVANPSSMHHKITLGGVLVNAGFQAADANALAGLLSLGATEFAERFADAAQQADLAPAAQIIANLLDADVRQLAALGLFSAWRDRLSLYLDDRAEWLNRDEEFQLKGVWREEPMTADQRWLIRVTCRVLAIGMPGHLLRGQAADWLEKHGANLNYGDFI